MADGLPRPDLYEEDFYLWTQAQAEALNAAGATGLLPSSLDWERLAEEVGDMGKRDLRGAKSLVRKVIEHLYKLEARGRPEPQAGWRQEVQVFRADFDLEVTPSIRKLVEADLERLHAMAAHLAQGAFNLHEPSVAIPRDRRWTLAQILGEEDDPLG
jgi:hypothetical protein